MVMNGTPTGQVGDKPMVLRAEEIGDGERRTGLTVREGAYIGVAKVFGPFYGFYGLGYWPPFSNWAGCRVWVWPLVDEGVGLLHLRLLHVHVLIV